MTHNTVTISKLPIFLIIFGAFCLQCSFTMCVEMDLEQYQPLNLETEGAGTAEKRNAVDQTMAGSTPAQSLVQRLSTRQAETTNQSKLRKYGTILFIITLTDYRKYVCDLLWRNREQVVCDKCLRFTFSIQINSADYLKSVIVTNYINNGEII